MHECIIRQAVYTRMFLPKIWGEEEETMVKTKMFNLLESIFGLAYFNFFKKKK